MTNTQRNSGITPEPACMIVVKDDDLHVVSSFWSAYDGGHGFHKVRASHSLGKVLATPRLLGQAIRAALTQFYIVPRIEDEPEQDALDELAHRNRGKFLKGVREVMIWRDNDTSALELVGAYGFTKNGFENLDKCEGTLPKDADDQAVGQAVVDMLKKIEKKVAK